MWLRISCLLWELLEAVEDMWSIPVAFIAFSRNPWYWQVRFLGIKIFWSMFRKYYARWGLKEYCKICVSHMFTSDIERTMHWALTRLWLSGDWIFSFVMFKIFCLVKKNQQWEIQLNMEGLVTLLNISLDRIRNFHALSADSGQYS